MSDVSEESDEQMRDSEFEFVERLGSTGAFDQAVGPAPGSPRVREPTENFYIGEEAISCGTQTQENLLAEAPGDFHQILKIGATASSHIRLLRCSWCSHHLRSPQSKSRF